MSLPSSSTWSSMKNSVLDQSGHLQSRGSNNVRKECCEWSAVSCKNEKTSSVQVYNCQTLNLQGGVGMRSRERNSLQSQNQAAEAEPLQEAALALPPAPVQPPALPWPQPAARHHRSSNHNLGKRSRETDEGPPHQQHRESPQVKRPRKAEENDDDGTEYYRPDWTVSPTDSGLNDVGISTQLCNSILLPADYDHIADKFPTFKEHVAGARTRCFQALTYVTALEQMMDLWRQQMARNVESTEAGDRKDRGNR